MTLGQLRNRAVIRLASRLETACYRRAAHIVVKAEEMVDIIGARGIPKHRISVVPNGSNTDEFRPDPEARRRLRSRLNLEGCFVVLYARLHGLAQDLKRLLQVAARLEGEKPEIWFVLIGEGPRKRDLESQARERDLSNAAPPIHRDVL